MKIINIKTKNSTNTSKTNLSNFKGKNKYFVPSNAEWFNSVYFYNTNNIKSIPILDKVSSKFIKTYLNMYILPLETGLNLLKLSKRRRWLFSRKVWINKIELKHTNDKVVINLHLYDRIYNIMFSRINYFFNFINFYKIKNNLESVANFVKTKNFHNTNSMSVFNKKYLGNTIKLINSLRAFYYYKLKYKNEFIFILQKIISRFYNKKVIFNIILLKNYYLNSSILTQILAHKSKDRENKINRTLIKTLIRIKVPLFRRNIINKPKKERYIQNMVVKYSINSSKKIDFLLKNQFYDSKESSLSRLNNKAIIGIRLESAGRLTKRFKAQRAIKKSKYIGTIGNVNSSLKGLSTQMVRNNITSSLQYSKAKSENRIGSFGIKGWINSI